MPYQRIRVDDGSGKVKYYEGATNDLSLFYTDIPPYAYAWHSDDNPEDYGEKFIAALESIQETFGDTRCTFWIEEY